jgi:hypothetical protein
MVATSNLHQCSGIDGVDRCSIHGGLTADLALEDVPKPPVGAGLPGMVVNDNAGCLNERGAQPFFASRLAPTIDRGPL